MPEILVPAGFSAAYGFPDGTMAVGTVFIDRNHDFFQEHDTVAIFRPCFDHAG